MKPVKDRLASILANLKQAKWLLQEIEDHVPVRTLPREVVQKLRRHVKSVVESVLQADDELVELTAYLIDNFADHKWLAGETPLPPNG